MAYGYYRTIPINHAKVPGNLINKDFLFKTTHLDLRTVGNGGHVTSTLGHDIVFAPNPDGSNRYDHEIEKYVAATGETIMWVRIPAMSSTVDTVIYVVYGDASVVVSQENITGVWDANFIMVQHMVDETTASILDSTSNNNDGTKEGANEPVEAAGPIGQAQDFDGVDDFIDCGNGATFNATFAGADKKFTIEAWINAGTLTPTEAIFAKNANAAVGENQRQFYWTFSADDELRVELNFELGFTRYRLIEGDTALNTGVPYHVVFAYDGSQDGNDGLDRVKFYVDGARETEALTATGGALGDIQVGTARVGIGAQMSSDGVASSYEYDGIIDEARVSNIERGTDYIIATFNNQDDPGTFYTFQAAEQIAHAARSGVTFASMIGIV